MVTTSVAPARRIHWGEAERTALLSRVRSLRALPPTTLPWAAALACPKRVEEGEFVFLKGEPIRTLSILAEGRVKVIRESDDGQAVILRLIRPGEIFGIVGSWHEPTYRVSALAQQDSVVLGLPYRAFVDLLKIHPEFALAILEELGSRLDEAETRIDDLQTGRAVSRLARALLRVGKKVSRAGSPLTNTIIAITRQDLADLAGTNVSTASRTLSEWGRRGIVDAGRERVRILRGQSLVAIAAGIDHDETLGLV
jgi:CRP-like cAMP-binding protein